MSKILAPNNQYSGISAGIVFTNGIGETADPRLIEWFKEKGYRVEDDPHVDPPKDEDPPAGDPPKDEDPPAGDPPVKQPKTRSKRGSELNA